MIRILIILLLFATVAGAEDLRYDGDRFVVFCAPGQRAHGRVVHERFPSLLRDVERSLGGAGRSFVTISIVPDDRAFGKIVGPRAPDIAAVAYPGQGLIVLKGSAVNPAAGAPLPAILRHELVHVVLGDLVPGRRLPLWFEEGLAEMVGGAFPVGHITDFPAAVTSGRILDFDDLERRFPEETRAFTLAYRQSENFVRFIAQDIGGHGIREIVRLVGEGRTFESALLTVSGRDRRELERRWRADLADRHPLWQVLFRNHWFSFLLFLSAVLAVLASGRYLVKRRRILRELDREDEPLRPEEQVFSEADEPPAGRR